MTGRGTDSAPTDPEPADSPTDEPLVEVDVSGATLRASDVAGNRIAIDLVGWTSWTKAQSSPVDSLRTRR